MQHEGSFNDLVHEPIRLRICGLLRAVDELDFAVLRDTLGISDATLSKHLKVLSTAGLVNSKKAASESRSDARRLTWLRMTDEGRVVFDNHIRALRLIASGAGAAEGAGVAAGQGAGVAAGAAAPSPLRWNDRDGGPLGAALVP
jgi:DNA-binding MarR family transcriptional regulator